MPHDLPILAARLREMHRAVERRQRQAAALLEADLRGDRDGHARGEEPLDEDDPPRATPRR